MQVTACATFGTVVRSMRLLFPTYIPTGQTGRESIE